MRRIPLATALLAALALAAPASAATNEDIAVMQQLLPADHPCRTTVNIIEQPGLRSADGDAIAAAYLGIPTPDGWMLRTTDGGLAPFVCDLFIDPARLAALTPCQQRRTILHEGGHMAGLPHRDGTIMDQWWGNRESIAVPGCPAILDPIADRVTDRIFTLIPTGWAVHCTQPRRLVAYCDASRGHRARRYRIRLHDQAGTSFTVRRIRAHRS